MDDVMARVRPPVHDNSLIEPKSWKNAVFISTRMDGCCSHTTKREKDAHDDEACPLEAHKRSCSPLNEWNFVVDETNEKTHGNESAIETY